MKIVVAPDSFKGSLSATEVARALSEGIRRLHPEWRVLEVPVADGGEGTVDAVLAALPGRRVTTTVKSPLLSDVTAEFAVLNGGETAVVEMAQASGLSLVPKDQRNPLLTTTFGTGQLILRAIQEGCRRIFVGMGGSATVDGGAGMAVALGVRFLDADGRDIAFGGGGLSRLHRIDLSRRIDISGIRITALSDVSNPLLGRDGAASVFGPQKGATPEMVKVLEQNLARLARIVEADLGIEVAAAPGAGAAGGPGAGILAFLNGDIKPGIGAIINLVGLREKVLGADLVITGEGKLDVQTAFGKAPLGVAELARELAVPAIAICGMLGAGSMKTARDNFLATLSLAEISGSQDEAMLRPKELLKDAVERFLASYPPPWPRTAPFRSQACTRRGVRAASGPLSHREDANEIQT